MGTLALLALQIGAAATIAPTAPPRATWYSALATEVMRTAARAAHHVAETLAGPAEHRAHRSVGYERERIVIVGDSMSAAPGYGPELSRRLTAAGIEHEIINIAVPGHRAEHWVTPTIGVRPLGGSAGRPARTPTTGDKLALLLAEHRPTTVLLELGTNERLDPSRPDYDAEVSRMHTLYATLVQRVNAAGARLVMAIGVQISREDGTGLQVREDLLNRHVLDPLWERYGPQGTYAKGLIDARVDWRPLEQDGLCPDGVHPDAAGWELRGRAWAAAGWNA